jgi:tetratricopeptide (TPR) repeat protein
LGDLERLRYLCGLQSNLRSSWYIVTLLLVHTDGISNPDSLVFFVDASSEDRIKENYQAIIRSRGIAYRTSTYESALQWLANTDVSWLIIADNADDPDLDLHPFVPQNPWGHFIITSRNANQGLMARKHAHHIEALDVSDAIKLLLDVSGYDCTDINAANAKAIVNTLGYLPLAIVQAAGYIYKHKCLLTYIDIYNESREKILAETAKELPHGYNLSVATTLEMSFNKLPIRSQQALCVLSFLQNTSIEHEIIETAARNRFFYASGEASGADIARLNEINDESSALVKIFSPGGLWSVHEFNEIIQPCFQYSLIQRTASINGQRFYSMHILAQTWLQIRSISAYQHSSKRLAKRLLLAVVREGSLYEHLSLHQMLLPHLGPFIGQPIGVATDDALLYRVLSDSKDDSTAMIHMTSYMELMKDVVAMDSLERLKAMRNLTWSLVAIGRIHEAVRTGEEAVDLCTNFLGREDPITLTSMGNLAVAYSSSGEYRKARDLDEETFGLCKKALGLEHTSTVASMGNLASSYRYLGEYVKARELDEQTLALRKKISGSEHPDTLISMNNLASSYKYLGEYDEARKLEEQAMSLHKKVSGSGHPDTFMSMNNLALSYRDLGKHEKARDLSEQTLALRKKVLGPEHPDTLRSMNNLALSYRDVGEYEKARELDEQTLAIRKRVLGPEHPDTLTSMNNLASGYKDLGEYEKARELCEQTLALSKKVLGLEHPDTLISMINLASNHSHRGEYEKARDLLEEALALFKKVLGPEHPDTLISMINLASSYRRQGDYEKARELDEQTLALSKKVLGAEHPNTLTSMNNLAWDYNYLGEYEKAREMHKQTLALRRRMLGPNHPLTLESMGNIANILRRLGLNKEAQEVRFSI